MLFGRFEIFGAPPESVGRAIVAPSLVGESLAIRRFCLMALLSPFHLIRLTAFPPLSIGCQILASGLYRLALRSLYWESR